MTNLILDNTNCPVNAFSFVKDSVEHINDTNSGRGRSKRQTAVWNRIDKARINGLDIETGNLIRSQINECIEERDIVL